MRSKLLFCVYNIKIRFFSTQGLKYPKNSSDLTLTYAIKKNNFPKILSHDFFYKSDEFIPIYQNNRKKE